MKPAIIIAGALALFWGVRAMRDRDVDILARTAWGEARGEGAKGMQAVLNVIVNRHRARAWYSGATLADTALKKFQFSAWNENDPNRDKVEAVTIDDPAFRVALGLARAAVAGNLRDITGGATHYYAHYINPPNWTDRAIKTAEIGDHIFFKGVA